MWIAAPGVDLHQAAPSRADQRSGRRVVEAEPQGGHGVLFLAGALVGGGQALGHLGARLAGGGGVEGPTERPDLVGRLLVRSFGRRRPGERDALRGDRGCSQTEAGAVGEPEPLGHQQLVERPFERVDLDPGLTVLGGAERRAQHRADRGAAGAVPGHGDSHPASPAGPQGQLRRRALGAGGLAPIGQPDLAVPQRDFELAGPARRRRDLGEAPLELGPIDHQPGRQQPAPAVLQVGGHRWSIGGRRKVDLQALDAQRAQIARRDRQQRPSVLEGEGHRRCGVGQGRSLSPRTGGVERRARRAGARCCPRSAGRRC